MVEAEENTLDSLVSTIRPFFEGKGLISVAIFGSVAKGLETKASDIDLLIIADDKESANDCASRASSATLAKFGAGLSPLIMSRTLLTRRQGGDFAGSVMEPYKLVWGKDLKELVRNVEAGR